MRLVECFTQLLNQVEFSDLRFAQDELPVWREAAGLKTFSDSGLVSKEDIEEFLDQIDPQRDWVMELSKQGDVDFGTELVGKRVRGNLFYFNGTRKYAISIRPIRQHPPTLNDLNLPETLTDWLQRKAGLILVCGPTGSGKTTTLAAMVNWINTHEAAHIITLEDPIEYIHRSNRSVITARQIKTDTATYADGIRAAMRQDPDVLLIGEIRDRETALAAFQAAESGHLVLGTLHASSAPKAAERMVDFFEPSEKSMIHGLAASVLIGVMTQTMLCNKDNQKIVAYELMSNVIAVASAIREGKLQHIPNIMQTQGGGHKNMVPLNKTLLDLYRSGQIDRQIATRASLDPQDFESNWLSRLGRA